MRSNCSRLITAFSLFLILNTCSTSQPPVWVINNPEFDGKFRYFVGLSEERVASEKDARNEAYANAVNKIVKYTGIDVKIIDEYVSEVLSQKSSKVIDPTVSSKEQVIQRAEALLRTIKEKQYYTETFQNPSDDDRSLYKVSVLVSIEKNEILSAIARLKEFENEHPVRDLIKTTERFEKQGKFTQALIEIEAAYTELKIRPLPKNESWIECVTNIKSRIIRQIENLRKEVITKDKDLTNLIRNGRIIASLSLIKTLKNRIIQSGINDEVLSVSSFRAKEQALTNAIIISAVSPVERSFELNEFPEPLIVRIDYKTNEQVRAISGFPVLFKAFKANKIVNTDFQGLARLSLPKPPATGRLQVVASPNFDSIKSNLSTEALSDLRRKEVIFVTNIIEELIPKPLLADFKFKIWPDQNKLTIRVGERLSLNLSCFAKRCYMILFSFDQSDSVNLIWRSNNKRLLVDEIKRISADAKSPDVISFYGIASTTPFPVLNTIEEYSRNDFKGIVKTLRSANGEKSEQKIMIEIKP